MTPYTRDPDGRDSWAAGRGSWAVGSGRLDLSSGAARRGSTARPSLLDVVSGPGHVCW